MREYSFKYHAKSNKQRFIKAREPRPSEAGNGTTETWRAGDWGRSSFIGLLFSAFRGPVAAPAVSCFSLLPVSAMVVQTSLSGRYANLRICLPEVPGDL
jgi:hypothetical protein